MEGNIALRSSSQPEELHLTLFTRHEMDFLQ